MSRPSIFASAAGIPAAAAADGSVWGVWPAEQAVEAPEKPKVLAEPDESRVQPVDDDVPWDDMMRRYGRRVVVALVSQGVPLERAKELAQDAWLRVIDRYRSGHITDLRLPGLVIAQAGFLARDDLRRSERRARLDEPRRQAANDVALDLEDQLDARQRLRVVHGVLDRASPNAQRVFALLYGERAMSPAEAAAELGLSVQRVRQIVCELRKRMRAAIAEPGRKLR